MFSNNPEFRGRNTGFQFNPLTHHTMRTYYQMISSLEYEPKDRHFTSEEEIEMLDKHFGLAGMSLLDLQNLRDMFVLLYTINRDKFSANARMSVTAVIDHFKMRKGGEV